MSVVIRVENLTKRFYFYRNQIKRSLGFFIPSLRSRFGQAFDALAEVSFEVQAGESVALIGKNGSGKSTLLKILSEVSFPTMGTVQVNGRVAALLELGAGFNPELTGRENVYLAAAIYGIPKAMIEARMDSITAFADIGVQIDQPVKFYSSGMYARLGFAISIHLDADIFIIDEALSVGDARFQLKCLQRLRSLKDQGKTLLFVSHDMAVLNNFTSRAIWLDKGRVKAQGQTVEVVKRYVSETAYDLTTTGEFGASDKLSAFAQFGGTRATIAGITLTNADSGEKAAIVSGGESLIATYDFTLNESVDQLGVGLQFKDMLGNAVFGFNNYVYDRDFGQLQPGMYQANVKFQMPTIENGTYFGSAAISNGTQLTHEQLHWIHDVVSVQIANKDMRFRIGHKVIIPDPVYFDVKLKKSL